MDPLQNLGPMVAEVDEANPTPEQQELQATEQRQATEREKGAREWAQIPFVLGRTCCMFAPELKAVYSEEACLEWGESMQLVAEKYGWKSAGVPELALLAATINMAAPTALALRMRLQALKAGQDAGWFGKLVLWWRHRRAAKEAAAAGDQAGGQAEVKP